MIEIARAELISSASPQAFFERWCDLESHPEWAPSMEFFVLHEPFGVGARGVLKARGGQETPLRRHRGGRGALLRGHHEP